MKIVQNLKDNKDFKRKIIRKAKAEEREELEKFYNEEINRIRGLHTKALNDQEILLNRQNKEKERNLRVELKQDKQHFENEYNSEIQYLNEKIASLDKKIKKIRKDFDKKEEDIYKDFEIEKKEIHEKYVDNIRELHLQIQDREDALEKARKGYMKYINYAIKALHLINDLRIEAEIWRDKGAEFHQRMETLGSKIDRIDRFNQKTAPELKSLLNLEDLSDDEIMEKAMKPFDSTSDENVTLISNKAKERNGTRK